MPTAVIGSFVGKFIQPTDDLVQEGYWLEAEAQAARRAAAQSGIGNALYRTVRADFYALPTSRSAGG